MSNIIWHRKSEMCDEECIYCDIQSHIPNHPELSECDDAECTICSIIHCPHNNELHFHHDGCPDCSAQLKHS